MKNVCLFYVSWANNNDTYDMFPSCLKGYEGVEAVDVSYFTHAEIAAKIRTASLVIVDHSIMAATFFTPGRSTNVYIGDFKGRDHYVATWDMLLQAAAPKVYIASGWDLHWTGLEGDDNYLRHFQAIAWLYEKPPTRRDTLAPEFVDDWMMRHPCPGQTWDMVRDLIPNRFELTHFLKSRSRNGMKIWDAGVYGVSYAPRRMVQEALEKAGDVSLAPFQRLDGLIFRFMSDRHVRQRIRVRSANQKFLVDHTAVSFVCGSAYNYPVRKYYEVAASGGFLLAHPCNGFTDLGFLPDENCVVVDFDNVAAQVKDLVRNEALRKTMAAKLQDTIYRLHNLETRTREFMEFVKYIYDGKTVVSEFKNGKFEHSVQ